MKNLISGFLSIFKFKYLMVSVLICGVILLILAVFILVWLKPEPDDSFVRPANVPLEAIYRGGLKGGTWILFEDEDNNCSNKFNITLYAGVTGELLNRCKFQLKGDCLTVKQIKGKLLGATEDQIFLNEIINDRYQTLDCPQYSLKPVPYSSECASDLPYDAIFVGAPKGGIWILFEDEDNKCLNIFNITLYADASETGEKLHCKYQLKGDCLTVKQIKGKLLEVTGDQIILNEIIDNRYRTLDCTSFDIEWP